jgi:ribosome-binding factor A
MMNERKRTDRVAQMIQRKLAQIIQQEVKDPRLPRLTSVSAVKVSPDLSFAKVYITTLGDDEEAELAIEILNNATSFLRTALARTVKLRIVPQLSFVYDISLREGNRMSRLLNDIVPDDDQDSEESNES